MEILKLLSFVVLFILSGIIAGFFATISVVAINDISVKTRPRWFMVRVCSLLFLLFGLTLLLLLAHVQSSGHQIPVAQLFSAPLTNVETGYLIIPTFYILLTVILFFVKLSDTISSFPKSRKDRNDWEAKLQQDHIKYKEEEQKRADQIELQRLRELRLEEMRAVEIRRNRIELEKINIEKLVKDGFYIRLIDSPTENEELVAVRTPHGIQMISNPSMRVQLESIAFDPETLFDISDAYEPVIEFAFEKSENVVSEFFAKTKYFGEVNENTFAFAFQLYPNNSALKAYLRLEEEPLNEKKESNTKEVAPSIKLDESTGSRSNSIPFDRGNKWVLNFPNPNQADPRFTTWGGDPRGG